MGSIGDLDIGGIGDEIHQRQLTLRSASHGLGGRESALRSREVAGLSLDRAPLRVGEVVRTTRSVLNDSSAPLPGGTYAEVTRIPGETPGSACELRVVPTGRIFDAAYDDYERLIPQAHEGGGRTPHSPPVSPEMRIGVTPARSVDSEIDRQMGYPHPPPGGQHQTLQQQFLQSQQYPEEPIRQHPQEQPRSGSLSYSPPSRFAPSPSPSPIREGMPLNVARRRIEGAKKAVLVGCDYRSAGGGLGGRAYTALREVEAALGREGFGGPVASLSDGNVDPRSRPTRSHILKAARWMVRGASPGDVFFFLFVGRSLFPQDLPRHGERYHQCLAPSDYLDSGYLFVSDLFKIFSQLPQGSKLTCLFDTNPGVLLPVRYKVSGSGQMSLNRDAQNVGVGVTAISLCPMKNGVEDVAGVLSHAFATALSWREEPSVEEVLSDVQTMLRHRIGAGCQHEVVLTSSVSTSLADAFRLQKLTRVEEERRVRNWQARLQAEEQKVALAEQTVFRQRKQTNFSETHRKSVWGTVGARPAPEFAQRPRFLVPDTTPNVNSLGGNALQQAAKRDPISQQIVLELYDVI